MYRRILSLGLLGCLSQGAYAADCVVGVALTGGPVVFNPFDPVSTPLNLEISYSTERHTNISVKFGTPYIQDGTPASSLSVFPHYIIENSANTEVFDSNDNVSTFPSLDTPKSLPTGGSLNYSLQVTPDSQTPTTDIAWPPLSSGSVTLPVVISGTGDTSGVCSGTHDISMNVKVEEKRAVALSNDFSTGSISESLDAGPVGTTPVTKNSTLYLWSNTKYKISAVSTNNGVMVRTTGSTNAVNKLPYLLTFSTSTPFSIGGPEGAPVASATSNGDDTATPVQGKQIDIAFKTQDTGKRAGTYSDTVTITISQSP